MFEYFSEMTQQVSLTLPNWIHTKLEFLPQVFPTNEDRMKLIIGLSQQNIDNDTGGPFAAGVFEEDTGKLVSIGVNRVMPLNCSSAHAEIMALSLAQNKLNTYDLGGPGLPHYQLVVNWRPCIMCYGAVIWSGVRSLLIAGSSNELESVTGFDEGPMGDDWLKELEKRGISVIDGLLKDEAIKVFQSFREKGMYVYNSRQG
jgi:tRNA(Arg) A34 adenosine deaminase TadA